MEIETFLQKWLELIRILVNLNQKNFSDLPFILAVCPLFHRIDHAILYALIVDGEYGWSEDRVRQSGGGGHSDNFIGFHEVGGYSALVVKYFSAVPNVNFTYPNVPECAGIPSTEAMHLFRPISDKELPWLGMTLGLGIISVWYWCCDQVIVQKALSSKNYSQAKGGCILAALYKFLPLWIMVLPGMIARVLFPNEVGCTDPATCERICFSRSGCTNVAYPLLVTRLLPRGLRGMMIAVLMSTVMVSLSSIFNSSSTLFTMDIWKTFRKNASSLELLIVGRLFVLFMVLVAVLWIPIIISFPSSQLFVYVNSVISYLAPPVAATFFLAILVPRVNEKGAFWGLIIGLVIGLTRFIMEASFAAPNCYTPDLRPSLLSKINYLHFGILLFAIVCFSNLLISFWTPPLIQNTKLHNPIVLEISSASCIALCSGLDFLKKIESACLMRKVLQLAHLKTARQKKDEKSQVLCGLCTSYAVLKVILRMDKR